MAASNKTRKKGTTRAIKCSGPIGATPEEPHEARNGGPRASQEGLPGSQKGYKTQWNSTICGLDASQGGSKQHDHEEEHHERPQEAMPDFGPQTLGR